MTMVTIYKSTTEMASNTEPLKRSWILSPAIPHMAAIQAQIKDGETNANIN